MKILITGGAGYIGSHTCLELLQVGYEVVVVDNLSNSKNESLRRVEKLTGKIIKFYKIDLLNKQELEKVFQENSIDAVIHFAGLKAVSESVEMPLRYYHNNITATLSLCEIMARYDVKHIVFSSSATVYGAPASLPINEEFPLAATNPYGNSKLFIEYILQDLFKSDNSWNIALLRYFNPVGSHASGRIGEDPNGIPSNLMPFVAQVAVGKLVELSIFGNDYSTADGTGVRDYIHVVDLALGHIKAIEKLSENPGVVIYNLGTGRGYSVLEMVKAFEDASGLEVPYRIAGRRPGDIAACFTDPGKAARELGWQAERGLEEMCRDTWRWQLENPDGYDDVSAP
ncbi:UDP-glucose 4-epimerase GalE [Desulfobacterota bacterium M19]